MTDSPPEWATAVPPTSAVHPSGTPDTQLTVPLPKLNLLNFITQFLENFLGSVVKALVGSFIPGAVGSAFSQLSNWATVGLPNLIISFVLQFIKSLLSPFGAADSVGTDLSAALNEVVDVIGTPLTFIEGLAHLMEGISTQHDSAIADLQAQITALKNSKVDQTTPTGFSDPCIDASGFDTPLIGTFTPTGYGTLTASATVFGHYTKSPTLDRNRVGMYVKTKRIGQTLLYFCSDNAADNWAGLLLDVIGNGNDTISIVTGTGPNSGIVLRTPQTVRLPSSGYYEIAYEPYSDDSPTSNTFHAFLGGNEIVPIRWPDDGNVIMHGTSDLRWGIGLNLLNNASHRGYDVTNVTFGNWLTGAPQ